ncbi:MAG TPA: carbohydrate ABC transporter permease [Microlunatus sp.]
MITDDHILVEQATYRPSVPHRSRSNRTLRRFLRRLPSTLAIAVLVVIVCYPIAWMLMSSLKSQAEFFSEPAWALPKSLHFENYVEALTRGNVAVNYRNSILATLPSLFFMLIFGLAAAYALEVLVWKGRHGVLLIFLAGIMVPGQMILAPLFMAYFRLGLTNSLWPLIITYTVDGLPLTIFLMAAYFRAIPRQIFEAATLDGCGMLRAFFVIGIPMMKNAIVTLALVEFLSVWNDLLVALTFSTSSDLATVQVGLLNFTDQFGSTDYGPLFAAISINIIAMLIIYVFLNKKIISGLASGSLKG